MEKELPIRIIAERDKMNMTLKFAWKNGREMCFIPNLSIGAVSKIKDGEIMIWAEYLCGKNKKGIANIVEGVKAIIFVLCFSTRMYDAKIEWDCSEQHIWKFTI